MQQAAVAVARPRRRAPHPTDSRHGSAVAPNILERTLAVAAPHVAWCGDITYVWTAEGWWYTSVLVDVSSRTVVGWAMREHVETQLGTNA
jgi:putative transposase